MISLLCISGLNWGLRGRTEQFVHIAYTVNRHHFFNHHYYSFFSLSIRVISSATCDLLTYLYLWKIACSFLICQVKISNVLSHIIRAGAWPVCEAYLLVFFQYILKHVCRKSGTVKMWGSLLSKLEYPQVPWWSQTILGVNFPVLHVTSIPNIMFTNRPASLALEVSAKLANP